MFISFGFLKWIIASLAFPLLFLLLPFTTGCSSLVQQLTVAKKLSSEELPSSREANRFFWEQFHQGHIERVPEMTERLMAAFMKNPSDLKVVTHLGFTHIWALSESGRNYPLSPRVLEHLSLSRRFFTESVRLNPKDPRTLGILADLTLAEGSVFHDPRLVVEGYFQGLDSITQWPQFNKFTLGYALSQLSQEEGRFKKALSWQWETLDDCTCRKQDRSHPNFDEIALQIRSSKDPRIFRACENGWIAPHNWEGFFMNFGDMAVKSGDPERGRQLYLAAKKSTNYTMWPFQDWLDERIRDADKNVTAFRKIHSPQEPPARDRMLIQTTISCMVCHQMSEAEFIASGHREPDASTYFLK